MSDVEKRLNVLTYFSKSIYQSNSVDEVMWDVAINCIKHLGFEDCVLYSFDEERQVLVQRAAYGNKNINYQIFEPIEIQLGKGIVGSVARSLQSEIVSDTRLDNRYIIDDESRLSEIAVPIHLDDKLIGVIDSEHADVDFYQSYHLDFLEDIASICAIKICRIEQQAENKELSLLFLENPNPMFRICQKSKLLLINKAAETLLPALEDAIHDQELNDFKRHIDDVLSVGGAQKTTLRINKKIFSADLLPFLPGKYVNVYLTEVTDYFRAKEAAEKANQEKADFMSMMSHEIRTPLNGILNINRLIKLENKSSSINKLLEAIEFSGESLLSIVNDILELEKVMAGKMDFIHESVNLRQFFEKIGIFFNPKVQEKGLKYKCIIDDSVSDEVQVDKARLRQIVMNLLNNALKFTTEGQITLKIWVDKNTHQGKQVEHLHCEVVDTGVGIKKSDIDSIFDHFFQIRQQHLRTEKGSGLGLRITKQLLEHQGGNISVDSVYGVGTTFTFCLPLCCDQQTVLKPRNTKPEQIYDLEQSRILCVDDSPINLMVLREFLNHWNAQPVLAESGEEAVELCKNTYFDLVLMDLQMPDMDGYDASIAIRQLTNDNRSTPVVMVSADVLTKDDPRIEKAQICDRISKPFNPIELNHLLFEHLPKQKQQQQQSV